MTKNTGTDPRQVMSPKSNWKLIEVLYETEHWSMAIALWKSDDDGTWRPVLAQRWNGWNGSKGNPISRGFPTWYVLPDVTYGLYLESEFVPPDKRPFVRDILRLPKASA